MPDQIRTALPRPGARPSLVRGARTTRLSARRPLGAIALVCAALVLTACERPTAGDDKAAAGAGGKAPETASGRISYGAGFAMADNLHQQLGDDFDGSAFAAGVADSVAGRERKVDDDALSKARDEIIARRQAAAEKEAKENLAAAKAFLEKNGKRDGVTTTASGLEYEVIKSGNGPSPKATDVVKTHYTGKLLDGTVFDSSEERGEPATFGLDRVIPGWTEALQLMHVGDRWRIWLPPDLAYGTRSPSDAIPPNSALEFEVELLAINPDDDKSGAKADAKTDGKSSGK